MPELNDLAAEETRGRLFMLGRRAAREPLERDMSEISAAIIVPAGSVLMTANEPPFVMAGTLIGLTQQIFGARGEKSRKSSTFPGRG